MASSFFERYLELCKQAGETPNSVAKIIGASSGSVTAWKNGTEPRYSTIVKIANNTVNAKQPNKIYKLSFSFFMSSSVKI